MKASISDKIISKISGGRINTVRVTRDEMIDFVDKWFIQQATTQEDYMAIWKVVKRGILLEKMIESKDGNYQMRSDSSQGGKSFRRYIWIYDKNENIYYEYNYYYGFYGKFKKAIKNQLLQAGFVM
jgi:hypothetical protein